MMLKWKWSKRTGRWRVLHLAQTVLQLLTEREPLPWQRLDGRVLGPGAVLTGSWLLPGPPLPPGHPAAPQLAKLAALELEILESESEATGCILESHNTEHIETLRLLSHHGSPQPQSLLLLLPSFPRGHQSPPCLVVQIEHSLVEGKDPEENEALKAVRHHKAQNENLESRF